MKATKPPDRTPPPTPIAKMAANDAGQGAVAAILAALNTMQSNVASKDKVEAHEFLEKFQKSVGMATVFSCAPKD